MPYIHKYNDSTTFTTDERCDINELLNTSDDESCSIAKAIVEVGVSTQLHAVKDTIERYIIIQGQGEVEINHQELTYVSHLDVVKIPAGKPQKITNVGDNPLIFLCICTPRFKTENYINLEIKDKYVPVSCQLHSELELAVMHHEKLEIELGQNTNNIEGWASDIFTSDKCEYIKIKGSDGCLSNIRLDIIVSYKVIK